MRCRVLNKAVIPRYVAHIKHVPYDDINAAHGRLTSHIWHSYRPEIRDAHLNIAAIAAAALAKAAGTAKI